jgi:uncharacterized protein (TIGR03437 family)
VSVKFGDLEPSVEYAGPQEYAGVEQVNVRLPQSLAGAGPASGLRWMVNPQTKIG